MTKKIKIIFTIFLVLNVLFFIAFNKPKIKIQKSCIDKYPDVANILQYGDNVKNIKFDDKYGNHFDFKQYQNNPVLICFLKSDYNSVSILNDSLTKHLKIPLENGLKIIYITKDKNDNKSIESKNINLFYDTDSLDISRKFHATESPTQLLLLNKEKTVLLSTVNVLPFSILVKIIENKNDELFN
jgi:hypothetical protein